MMTALTKLLIGMALSLMAGLATSGTNIEENTLVTSSTKSALETTEARAYQILRNKCNVCHTKRNKRRVFTPENRPPWANDSYTQVFLKRSMPKGAKIKLTDKEYQELLTWITSVKNEI